MKQGNLSERTRSKQELFLSGKKIEGGLKKNKRQLRSSSRAQKIRLEKWSSPLLLSVSAQRKASELSHCPTTILSWYSAV